MFSQDVPGITKLGKHSITLTSEEPIHSKPYSLPHAMQKEVEKELDDMLKLGTIEPTMSFHSSPMVVVRKPDGSSRVCVDFRKLIRSLCLTLSPCRNQNRSLRSWKRTNIFSRMIFPKAIGKSQYLMTIKHLLLLSLIRGCTNLTSCLLDWSMHTLRSIE